MTTIPDPQVFRDAIDVIRERGWHQGDFFDGEDGGEGTGACCTAGAIRFGTNGDPQFPSSVTDAAELWLVEHLLGGRYMEYVEHGSSGGCGEAIGRWNDEQDRTIADVLALLNRAVAEAARCDNCHGTGPLVPHVHGMRVCQTCFPEPDAFASAAESALAAQDGGGLPIDVMHASADGPGVQAFDRYDPDGDLDAGGGSDA